MPYMYILRCSDGSFYTGSTWNLQKRIFEHQNGIGANHTKKHLPVSLVYYEQYERVEDAFKREKQIQKWSRSKKVALIEANVIDLKKLSECRNESNYRNAALNSAAAFDSAQAARQRDGDPSLAERSRSQLSRSQHH